MAIEGNVASSNNEQYVFLVTQTVNYFRPGAHISASAWEMPSNRMIKNFGACLAVVELNNVF
jgi:hypothetical protein